MTIHITEKNINRLKRVIGDQYQVRKSYTMFAIDEYVIHPKSWWFFRRWFNNPMIIDLDLVDKGGIWIEAKTKFLEDAEEIAPILKKEFRVGIVFVDEI